MMIMIYYKECDNFVHVGHFKVIENGMRFPKSYLPCTVLRYCGDKLRNRRYFTHHYISHKATARMFRCELSYEINLVLKNWSP